MEIVRCFGASSGAPTTLHWLVTTECSMNCEGCFYRDTHGEWDWEAARVLVKDAAMTAGTQWLAIGGGEPLEWEKIYDLIYIAHNQGLKVAMTTNGMRTYPGGPDVPDRVHISHDEMHLMGMPWDIKEDLIHRAVDHYRSKGCGVGLNTMYTDAHRIGKALLKKVDVITLMLPKPIPEHGLNTALFHHNVEHLKEHTDVAVDSCLNAMMTGWCFQGRTSMSYDQAGRPGLCSNVEHILDAGRGLHQDWEDVRLREEDVLPECCLVRQHKEKRDGTVRQS